MKSKTDAVTEEVKQCPIYKVMELFQGKSAVWVLLNMILLFRELFIIILAV